MPNGIKPVEWPDLKATADKPTPIKSTLKILYEYAENYENAVQEKAGSDATWHIPILEAWPLIQRLTQALRRIENITHCDEDWGDQDHMQIAEQVNIEANKALK